MQRILEVSSKSRSGGKRNIKMVLLTIHNGKDVNLNGIHWSETYIQDNLESIKGIPICCEFLDEEKEVPYGHGYSGMEVVENDKQEPLFENSEVVGSIESAQIEEIDVDNTKIKALVGYGYLYNQRYPNLVKWVKTNMVTSSVKSSIEIVGTDENNGHIVYDGVVTSEYRVPKVFDFSATAILSVKEADENAYVLEVAQSNTLNNTKKEGVTAMDEKDLMKIKEIVTEVCSKNAQYETEIATKDTTIAELNSQIEAKTSEVSELNATVEQLQKALDDLKKDQETSWRERDILEKELAQIKVEKRLANLNAELSQFTAEQQAYAQAEIDAFKADPMNCEINTVTDKILVGIGKKSIEDAKISEINSQKEKANVNAIYGDMYAPECKTKEVDESIYY